jgi:hypothetical protein
MLSSVLNSERAIAVNIAIMRAFVRLRDYLATHKDLAQKIDELDRTQQEHGAHIQYIYDYIQGFLEPVPTKRRIGFATTDERD